MMRFLALCIALCALTDAAREKKGTNQHLWQDTETATMMWRLVSGGSPQELEAVLEDRPEAVHVRSSDGRGPLWWAYEYGKDDMVKILLEAGANGDEKDADGKKPVEVREVGKTQYEQDLVNAHMEDIMAMDDDEEDDY